MAATESTRRARRDLGAWATPPELVELVVSAVVTPEWVADRRAERPGRPIRLLDPACGDGRFLRAAADAVSAAGATCRVTGIDVDEGAVGAARTLLRGHPAEVIHADALATEWPGGPFDLVVGNPPFLSQLDRRTTRGGSSRHGGGPYADAAAEFLVLAVRSLSPGGRVGLVLPQSVLGSRDVAPVRAEVDALSRRIWSWWSPDRWFDAEVVVCALGFERRRSPVAPSAPTWSDVVTRAVGIPDPPVADADGVVGDRATIGANFRDEYYGLVGAVSDTADGPPLVTTGLIDPGRSRWGTQPVRIARQRYEAPRVDLARLDGRMQAWAARKLVPKVLVATQTRVVEAVVDDAGVWLPAVPVITAVPHDGVDPWAIGAVLTSPLATSHVWWQAAGTGLSGSTVRVRASHLAATPWPAGDLGPAVRALRGGDIAGCGRAVAHAAGWPDDHPAISWWAAAIGDATVPPSAPTRATRRSSTAATDRSAR
ncbi:MAG: N-6 DNA methylase [Ilumatobacteraceae bacterium]|nr:N-6 DNA methylase [Ilumatobacteraceae bacterium]